MPIFDVRFGGVPTLGATQILGNSTVSSSSYVSYLRQPLACRFPWFSRTKMLLLVLGLLAGSFALSHAPTVVASNNPGIPLYLHQLPNNVTISGVQTTHVLNTTTLWDGTAESPNLRYNVFNFTLYPALTSALTSIGPGSIVLWVTVSGAPGSLNATIYDASAAGQLAVVSTSAVITLNSSPTVPYKETLGFNINLTFTQASTIKLSVTVFRVSQLYVWYDSASYSSALVMPVSNIPTVNLVETFTANFTAQTSFSLNWTTPQRIVFLTVHVADPFGAYHVANANVTITGPGSTTVFSAAGSSLTTNPAAPEKLFAASWPYSTSLPNGTYVVSATANDTAGDQASSTVNIYLTSISGSGQPSNPPPISPPNPPNSSFPSIYWLIAAALITALIGALLAFLLFARKRRVLCSKCHARVDPKLEKCPFCGNQLAHPKGTEEPASLRATQQPSLSPPSEIGDPRVSSPAPGSTLTPPKESPKTMTTNDEAPSPKEKPHQ